MSDIGRPDEHDRIRVHVVVHGLVQGVWFRESCRRAAIDAGIGGWVRNRADGTVEAELEGAEDAVARVVAWCRRGPPRADVTAIDVAELERWSAGAAPTDRSGDAAFHVR